MEFQNDHSSKVIADRLSLAIELAMSWSAKKDLRLVSCCQWMTLIQGINVISQQISLAWRGFQAILWVLLGCVPLRPFDRFYEGLYLGLWDFFRVNTNMISFCIVFGG